MKEKLYAWMSGAFFMGAVYGLTISNIYVWLPCVGLSLITLVLATE